jgi:hypothetical protein
MMKTIKINLALVALLAGSTLAFAFNVPVKHHADSYWQYDGTGSVTDESNYFAVSSPTCPTGSNQICAILAPADPAHPNEPQIDSNLASRITNKDTSDGDVFLKR